VYLGVPGQLQRVVQDHRISGGQAVHPHTAGMQASPQTLAELLSMAGLLGATIEYAELVKRRALARRDTTMRQGSGDLGLRGLVRVLLADEAATRPPTKQDEAPGRGGCPTAVTR